MSPAQALVAAAGRRVDLIAQMVVDVALALGQPALVPLDFMAEGLRAFEAPRRRETKEHYVERHPIPRESS